MRGKIVEIKEDRGFGYIECNNSKKMFFHINSFSNKVKIQDLNIGATIEFDIGTGSNGRQAAINCKIIEDTKKNLIEYLTKNALIAPSCAEGYDEFCDNVKEYALILKKKDVTISMIRKIYSQILAAENVIQLKMLRPQFAYTAGRNEENHTLKEFMEMLDEIVKSMKTEENSDEIKNFKQFMEAIVAYRKYHGDKKRRGEDR